MNLRVNAIRISFLLFICCTGNYSKSDQSAIDSQLLALDNIVKTAPDSVLQRTEKEARYVLSAAPKTSPNQLFQLFLYSKALFVIGEIDSSHFCTLKGIEKTKDGQNSWLAGKFLGQAGYKHTVTAQFDSAALYFSQAKQCFSIAGDSSEYYKSIINWAMAESKVHHRSTPSRWAMRDAVNYYTRQSAAINIALAATNIASHYSDEQMRDSARYYLSIAEKYLDAVPPVQQPQILLNLGISAEEDSLYNKAFTYYSRAEQIPVASTRIKFAVACNKGILLNKTGKPDSSLMVLNDLLVTMPEETDFRDLRQLALKELAEIYEKKKNWPMALKTYQHASALSDTLIGWSTQAKLSDIRAQYELSEKSRVVALQKADIQLRNVVLSACIILLLLLAYVYNKRKKLLKAERLNANMLTDKNEELIQANQQLNNQVKKIHEADTLEQLMGKEIVLNNRENTRLVLRDIRYIISGEGGVYYHNRVGEPVFNWQSLRSCLELLPKEGFMQISKNTIVAKSEIIGKTPSLVRLRSGESLPVGAAFRENLL